MLEEILFALKLLEAAVVGLIVGGLASFGINVPPIVVQVALIAFTLWFFWRWAQKLPWLIVLILVVFLVALVVGIFT